MLTQTTKLLSRLEIALSFKADKYLITMYHLDRIQKLNHYNIDTELKIFLQKNGGNLKKKKINK